MKENNIKERRFSKKDAWILLAAAVVIAVVFIIFRIVGGSAVSTVTVTVDGKEYGRYPLNSNRTVEISQNGKVTNVLVIRDGKADMTEADCPDQLCVHQKPVSKDGESIVCLPNRVIVVAENPKEERNLDGIAN